MSTCRVCIGVRNNGDRGIFVAPVGGDAMYGADNTLILNISTKIPQLLMLGFVTANTVIPLGFTRQPIVLVTGSANLSGIPGYSQVGPTRPSPMGYGTSGASVTSYAVINSGGASMTIIANSRTSYAVHNMPF